MHMFWCQSPSLHVLSLIEILPWPAHFKVALYSAETWAGGGGDWGRFDFQKIISP